MTPDLDRLAKKTLKVLDAAEAICRRAGLVNIAKALAEHASLWRELIDDYKPKDGGPDARE